MWKLGPDIRTGKNNSGPWDAMLSKLSNITYEDHVTNEEAGSLLAVLVSEFR